MFGEGLYFSPDRVGEEKQESKAHKQQKIKHTHFQNSKTPMKCFVYMRHLLPIVCIGVLYMLLCPLGTKAEPSVQTISISSLKDSMEAAEDVNLLVNTVYITNNSKKVQRIGVRTTIPKGWKNLSKSKYVEGDDIFYNLLPGQVINIPINLLRLPDASPMWSSVSFLVWNRDYAVDTQKFSYHIKTFTRKNFVAVARNQEIEVSNNDRVATPTTYIRNTGNIKDVYIIRYKNYQMGIDDSVQIELQPGTDTVYTHNIDFNSNQIHNISSEKILITVYNSELGQSSYSYSVNKYAEKNKANKTPYDAMPLRLEGGYMTFGDKHVYFGSLRGRLPLGEKRSFEYYYRSKQYGNVPTGLRRNIFRLYYKDKNWSVAVGQISAPMYFILNTNRGVDITYQSKGLGLRLVGTAYDTFSYYKNNNISLIASYGIGGVSISNNIIFNSDHIRNVNSYVLLNDIALLSRKNLSLNIRFGVGIDQAQYTLPQGQEPAKPGMSGGYSFKYRVKKVTFSSNINHYNNDFPGVKRGSTSQVHDAMWNIKGGAIGLFYSSNHAITNYFRDSLFNSDILSYNVSRFGVRMVNTTPKLMSTLSSGILTQSGTASLNGGLKNSYFLDLMAKWSMGKTWNTSFNTQTAFGKHPVQGNSVFVMTTTVDVNSRYGGVTGVFTRTPITGYEGGQQIIGDYVETVNGGPYVNFYMFRNRLFGSVRYNVSKSLKDDMLVSGVGGNLAYNGIKSGVGVNLSTFYPFGIQTNDPGLPLANRRTLQLSISKQLNIPIVVKRKYYDLKVIMYEDKNHNHKMDADEQRIEDVRLQINNDPFISNEKGEIVYKNINNGTYKIKIHDAKNNIVPIDGFDQTVTVYKNTQLEIPFKKGRLIVGKVDIILDSFSSANITPDYIKITATGADGTKYTTLTDHNGEFRLAVPAGQYSVSINADLFAGTTFKADQSEFKIDLNAGDSKNIVFTIKQKVRKVRYLNR